MSLEQEGGYLDPSIAAEAAKFNQQQGSEKAEGIDMRLDSIVNLTTRNESLGRQFSQLSVDSPNYSKAKQEIEWLDETVGRLDEKIKQAAGNNEQLEVIDEQIEEIREVQEETMALLDAK